jgi:DNA-directed RNA polymerase specialized sigma24 family protein
LSTPATHPRHTRNPASVAIPRDASKNATGLLQAMRDDFLTMAYREQSKILKPFDTQPEWLLERAYWQAVGELLKGDKYATLTHPRSYLKSRVRSRVIDAIRKDARERRAFTVFIGAKATWERGLEYWHFGEIKPAAWSLKAVEDPGVIETFGYVDFVRWLKRQDRTDAEVLLQKSVTEITDTDLAKRFGRDRFWVKRVYIRMAKKLVRETGLYPHEIEGMVSEAERRNGPVYPLRVVSC